ncbi:helix-turn-helix domain-containing protein [Glutamicibacter sp. AOP5-A2-18]|uniref:helix-turn-helix domain-containing protein n=1 Tax=Glutamicibacter sp. AOP5-A2-18 TaxID=3457656 RepID=UPI0040339128
MSNEAQALTRKMAGSGAFSSTQVIVMMLLADHADEKWSCFPSVELLMHHSQLKERTVRACLKGLSEKGVLVIREQRSQATGAQLANRYVLNRKKMAEFAQDGEAKWQLAQARKKSTQK